MSGEREAVEARARAHREKVRDNYVLRIVGTGLATQAEYDEPAIMADFSLAENAEREKQYAQEVIELKTQRNLAREARENWRKRAEAAEAEVVKLREALEKIRAEAHKGAVSMSLDAHEFHELELLAESALNPGAAKEG